MVIMYVSNLWVTYTEPDSRVQYCALPLSESALAHGSLLHAKIDVYLQALNDSMFGNTECYEGEGLEEDDEYAPHGKRHRHNSDSE